MSKPLIIGQAPARGNEGQLPFTGRSGARLAQLLGVGDSGDVLPEYFDLVNLLDFWPGRAGKGDLFPTAEARKAGLGLLDWLQGQPPLTLLLMGRKVRRAMGVGDHDYLEWFSIAPHHQACIFPHPSRVNRWWNDRGHRRKAQFLLQEVAGLRKRQDYT